MHDAQKVRFWIAAAAITAINVALWVGSDLVGNKGPMLVRLAQASSAQEFEETGRLSLRFDREVYSQEQIESSLQHPPFHISPELPGQWTVLSEDELAFEPDSPPAPGHVYRVDMTKEHRFFDNVAIEPTDLPEIRYKPLKLQHAELVLTQPALERGAVGDRLVTIEICFNQNVSRAQLQEHLQTRVNGQLLGPEFQGEALAAKHRFDLIAPAGKPIGINIDKDLTGHAGSLGLEQSISKAITVPLGLHMSRVEAQRYWWRASSPEVHIHFDRNLSTGQKPPVIEISPSPGPMQVRFNGNRIVIKANFTDDIEYAINCQPPLLAADGSVLETGFKSTVRIPRSRPRIDFPRAMGRLGTSGAFQLDLDASSVEEARVRIDRLLPRHIPIYLSGVMMAGEIPRLGTKVAEKTIQLHCKESTSQRVALDLSNLMERAHGVYLVSIESTKRRWSRDSMLLFVGDLGLEVMHDGKGLLAWVTNVETGLPVPGVEVIAWKTNRTELVSGTTDGYGLIRLDATTKNCDLITASLEQQIVFVDPRKARGIEDRALAGARWSGPLDVALYAERGVHRPGETIRLSGVVRGPTGELPGRIPLEIRVTRPDDRVIFSEVVDVDEDQGMFHVQVPTQPDSPTGNWIVRAHVPGDEKFIAGISCPIMPFLPVRLAVEASNTTESATLPEVSVHANYLHGAAASGLAVKLTTEFLPVRYGDERFEDFRFEDPPTSQTVKQATNSALDEFGNAIFQVKPPKIHAAWRGMSEATVLEIGGRPTTARTRINLDTTTMHLGVRLRDGALYRTHEPITVEAVRLDAQRNPITSGTINASLQSINHEWNLVDSGNGQRRWRSIELLQPVANVAPVFNVSDDNLRTCVVPPLPEGAYRLVASIPPSTPSSTGEAPGVTLDFHVSDYKASGRIAADRPDRIEMIPEDSEVVPGMETSVLLRSAFPGLALVTVETDRIHDARVVAISGDGARIPFTVPLEARDTCFVAATILRPLDSTRTQWLPIRARGATRLKVSRDEHRLDISIRASDAARPGEQVRVMLAAPDCIRTPEDDSAPALVHLWAVEEGALLVTDYHAPDLVDRFLRDRRRIVASVGTSEVLLPDYQRPVTVQRIGGDASRRFREPVPTRQPETAVLWRTSMPLPADGLMDVELEMPEIDGAMRIMAVVVQGDRFGKSEHVVGVVAPIQVLAAFPRAAAPGDTMLIPVRVRNNTSEPAEISLKTELGNGLKGELDTDSLLVPPHGEEFLTLTMVAGQPGSAQVVLTATPAQPTPRLQTQVLERWIAVRPPHGRDRSIIRLNVPPGESFDLDRDRSLEALAGHVEIVVGGHPSIDLKPALDDLIQYPYGCGEQTGSRTRGLLAALRLPEEITGRNPSAIRDMASAGIKRLWWMQRSDGAIPYWRGGKADAWLTLRTAMIALDAEEAGIELPEGFIEGLLQNINTIARPKSGRSEDTLATYACRVLSRANMPDEALMATRASTLDSLDLTSRAHLADAFFAVGELEEANRILVTFTAPAPILPNNLGRFTSGVHQAAIAMDVLLRNQPEHPLVVEYARFINDSRGTAGWRTTFENAAVFDAMSRWHASFGDPLPAHGSVTIAGRTFEFEGNTTVRHAFDVSSDATPEKEVLISNGQGAATLLVTTSGIPMISAPKEPKSSIIEIRRTWFDATGEKIKPGTSLQAGDLVTVELVVRSKTGVDYTNVAIVDVLPGGMEFELPSLLTSAGRDKSKLDSVDRVEFRDDRLVAFSSVTPEARTIRYLARAIVPGEWAVAAPDALAMYNPEAHGRGSASRVEIQLP